MSVQNVGTSQRHATLSEDHATIGGKIRRHARCVNSYPPIFIYSFSIFISLMCIRDFVDILTRFIGFSQNRSHAPGKAAATPSRPQHFLDVAPEPLGFEIQISLVFRNYLQLFLLQNPITISVQLIKLPLGHLHQKDNKSKFLSCLLK